MPSNSPEGPQPTDAKPFRCPKPNCTKSYKNANGLKYHTTHGSCNFAPPKNTEHVKDLLEFVRKRRESETNEGLSRSASLGAVSRNGTDSTTGEPFLQGLSHTAYGDLGAVTEIELLQVEQEAQKRLRPFVCGIGDCQRRYKNMNGLRYHYQHSGDHGAVGLELLAAGLHECSMNNDDKSHGTGSDQGNGKKEREREGLRSADGVQRIGESIMQGGSMNISVSRATGVAAGFRDGTPAPLSIGATTLQKTVSVNVDPTTTSSTLTSASRVGTPAPAPAPLSIGATASQESVSVNVNPTTTSSTLTSASHVGTPAPAPAPAPFSIGATMLQTSVSVNVDPTTTSSTPTSAFTSKGQIHVKLIQARGLNVRASSARPYVVILFEQNEFISRDAVEVDKEVKGTAKDLPSSPASSSSLFSANSAHSPIWKHEVSFDVTSKESFVTFNVYDRSVEDQGFLGSVQVKPVLVHDHRIDQWYKLKPYANEVVTGEIRLQISFEQYKTKKALTPRDFEFLKLIGRGSFGRVFQVRKRDTKRIYAMKIISKKETVAKKQIANTISERKILQRASVSPFLTGLKFSFQTETDLYLVTDFKSGGGLFWHLLRETRFSEARVRFYVAELILALEYLHNFGIIYRDLKPENVLLDATGHIALCDFGLSKPDLHSDALTNTFCGTVEYLAPEVLLDEEGYSKLVDFWSLGVIFFEMSCGWSPFYAEDTQQMYKNICFGKIRFPSGVVSQDGKRFVKELLNRNPKHRLGATRGAAELKEHPFFSTIDWKILALKQVTPPFKPFVESDESTYNFHPAFTSTDISDMVMEDPHENWVSFSSGNLGSQNRLLESEQESQGIQIRQRKNNFKSVGSPLTNSIQANFRGFTYSGEESVVAPPSLLMHKANVEAAVNDDDQVASGEEMSGSLRQPWNEALGSWWREFARGSSVNSHGYSRSVYTLESSSSSS